jgi:acetate kinase
MTILTLNAGSSSLKLALFQGQPLKPVAQGLVQRVGSDDAVLDLTMDGETLHQEHLACPDHPTALRQAFDGLDSLQKGWSDRVSAVGHRIVHGGSLYTQPTLLSAEVEKQLSTLTELAPLHNRRAVEVVRAALSSLPHVPQVACFDTMFHTTLPPEAARYALPRDLSDRLGIRRYGFHGLSCAWSMSRLAELGLGGASRVVICHLGAGASVTAVRDGRSVDTTMGFTPLEGLIMATRSGSIDPSIVLYLQRHADMDVDAVEHLLESESGLLALSGQSGDVQTLEAATHAGDERAEEALEAFAYQVRKAIGAYWAVLGSVDIVVLTGGIGEHSADMRARILRPLEGLGLWLDEQANGSLAGGGDGCISRAGCEPAVWVIVAQEERVIARQVQELLASSRSPTP